MIYLAMFGNPMEVAILVGAAVLLFGGSKIRDVARGLGAAKKEFMVGQAEAEIAAERARAEARAHAEATASSASAAAQGQVAAPPVGAPTETVSPANEPRPV